MNKATVAYVRCSTLEQETELQRTAIQKYLREKNITAEIMEDKASGKNTNRKGYQALLGRIRAGWVSQVIVYDVSRLGRSAMDNMAFAQACVDRGVSLVSLRDGVDINTPAGELLFYCLSWSAERQREMIVMRAKEGSARRRAKGLPHGGTSKGWTYKRVAKELPRVYEMRDLGYSIRKIQRLTGLKPSTIRKYLAKRGEKIVTRKEMNKKVYGKSNAKV